jgi:hypothetical protein
MYIERILNVLNEARTTARINSSKEDKILVIDTNLGLEFARRFGKDNYETYYAIVHCNPYPKMQDEISGYGFKEIKKVSDFGQGLENGANVIVFTDSGYGYLADYLRNLGYYVFGSDSKTEKLELDRVYARNVLSKLGIDIPPARVVRGVDGVIQAIKEAKGKVYIKINKVRGDVETFGTDDPYEAEIILSRGAFKILGDNVQFVVENELDGVEIGIDAWFNGKQFIPIVANTIEMKGAGNITKFTNIKDSIWYPVLQKLEPWLRKNGYVGMFCMEGFYDGYKLYVTDITPRFPYICGYAYPKVIKNFSEFMIGVSKGQDILPEIDKQYSVQIGVYTDDPDTWRVIHYDRNDIDWIAFRRVIYANDKYWFVPGDYVVAVGISESNDIIEAMNLAIQRAEGISTNNIYTSGYDFAAYIEKTLLKAKRLGLEF